MIFLNIYSHDTMVISFFLKKKDLEKNLKT